MERRRLKEGGGEEKGGEGRGGEERGGEERRGGEGRGEEIERRKGKVRELVSGKPKSRSPTLACEATTRVKWPRNREEFRSVESTTRPE
eukprot:762890-Hanusia_phi.AAC.4